MSWCEFTQSLEPSRLDVKMLISLSNLAALSSCQISQRQENYKQLEQLERLRSEDTPRRPVITHTIDQFILNPKSILLTSSYQIPSQKKAKAEKNRKICEKFKF